LLDTLEWTANAVFVVSVILAARNNINTWWTGIVGCLLFAVLFYQVNLYADVTLMFFFIITSIYGWIYWGNKKELHPIRRTATRSLAIFALVALLATCGYGWMLHSTTDAYAPFVDSSVLMFSVLAQLLLMKRRIETWVCWLIVDSVAVPLYASRELYVTSAVYGVFWCNAWYGLYTWLQIYRNEQKGEPSCQPSTIAVD
jgi:nicotinamide mononucleotide transporter